LPAFRLKRLKLVSLPLHGQPSWPCRPLQFAERGKLANQGKEHVMSNLVEELSQRALELPPEERVRLAERLLATVHEIHPDVEAAWDEEIKRRLAEIDNGTARLIPAEEVFAEARRILK